METVYTKEEHDKCKRVAEAFQELYAMYGDMCVRCRRFWLRTSAMVQRWLF